MAELVDALVSGTSARKSVQVRVLFWAPSLSSPGGGIGRRARLRAWWPLIGRASSILVLGTNGTMIDDR